MGDIKLNLDFLPPEKPAFLRRRLQERDSVLEEQIERVVDDAMNPGRAVMDLGSDEVELTPEELERTREEDRELTRALREAAGGETEESLLSIAGLIDDESPVTSENFHDYLYGQWGDDR